MLTIFGIFVRRRHAFPFLLYTTPLALAFTGSGVVSLAITAAVVATVCASLLWHRKDVHGR